MLYLLYCHKLLTHLASNWSQSMWSESLISNENLTDVNTWQYADLKNIARILTLSPVARNMKVTKRHCAASMGSLMLVVSLVMSCSTKFNKSLNCPGVIWSAPKYKFGYYSLYHSMRFTNPPCISLMAFSRWTHHLEGYEGNECTLSIKNRE